MISEKDRSQLLRMAGNIACGLAQAKVYPDTVERVADLAADIALATLKAVDKKIAEANKETV